MCVCVRVYTRLHVCRAGHNIPEKSAVADTVPSDSQQLKLQDDHIIPLLM